jgi:predicted metal-binding transcription factor (methanogenesis marker protein 9)
VIFTYNWRSLASIQQLCDGGPLASIVFCCDPRRKKCPVLERALRELGLTVDDFVSVMERHRVPVPEVDGSCYGNLAFCPSLEVKSRDRDEFLLKSSEWSLSKYLEYKYKLLLHLLGDDPGKLEHAFSRSVVEKYAGFVINTNTGKAFAVVLVGNPELGGFRVLTLENVEYSYIDNVSTGYLNVRLPHSVIVELESLVKAGVIVSKSDAARKAILLFLQAIKRAF